MDDVAAEKAAEDVPDPAEVAPPLAEAAWYACPGGLASSQVPAETGEALVMAPPYSTSGPGLG